jgi:hypothetical protein
MHLPTIAVISQQFLQEAYKMTMLETLVETLTTGSGFWNPIFWVSAGVIAFLIMYLLRSYGKKTYKEQTEQTKSFLSGNPEYDKEHMHIKASNVYWGFVDNPSLKWIFDGLRKMHTGNASDYVLWFVVILAFFFIMIEVI